MDKDGASTKTCGELKQEYDEAKRRHDELLADQPKVIEPLPLADIPGGSLEQGAEHRAELERSLAESEAARRAFEEKCGPL